MEKGLNKKNIVSELFYMIPAFVFVLSILLVRLHLFSMPMSDIYWTEATDTSTLTDVFNYGKAITIIIAAVLASLVFIVGYFRDSIHFKKSLLYIPALVYAVFILISLLFSNYKYFALRGMNEHFEGTIVLLSYLVMVCFFVNAVDSERRLKCVVYCALCAACLLGFLGITQASGRDFLSTAAGQKLMTPNYVLENGMKSWDMIDILAASGQKAYDFSFTEGEVYQTVYNINYVSFYLSLLIPLSAILFVALNTNANKAKKGLSFIFLALYGLYLYNFFAANSASGYFGLFAIFIAALIVFRRYLKKWIRPIICLIIVLGLVMGLTVDRWMGQINPTISSALRLTAIPIYAENEHTLPYDYDASPGTIWMPFDYIKTGEKDLILSLNHNEIIVERNDEEQSFHVVDGNREPLYLKSLDSKNTTFSILDDRFYDYIRISLTKDERGETYIIIRQINSNWQFHYNGTEFKYCNAVGKEVSLDIVPHAGIIKNYRVASSRGRIWDTTIPMLSSYLLIGAGADTFTFVFPQNDYATISATSGVGHLNLVTDKAHNLYLQYWVNTGLISLLAWLAMVGYYLAGAVKQFRKRGFTDFCDFVNGGIFCGILGFLAVALFNDGSVNTMPMFYTMLGTGLAINMRDKWPASEGSDVSDAGEGKKKKEKKAKPQAGVMPEM